MTRAVIRVGVAGALGNMGRVACAALRRSTGSLTFAGGFARKSDSSEGVTDDLDQLLRSGVDVLLDLTTHPGTVDVSMRAVAMGVRPVIGATGWTEAERSALSAALTERKLGGMLVPNFSLGAAVLMRLADEAAKYFESAEIVEMHRAEKKDAPSGTALLTAERIAHIAGKRPPIHSIRLPGLVAHQEVMFGGTGELLTLRHDSFSRESFVPGMFAAVKAVMHARGLVVGLEAALSFDSARDDAG